MEHKDRYHTRVVAHCGWNKPFPENSLVAFAAAVAAGAHEIEFDVRVSKDRVPFICHDASVDRVSDLSGRCDSLTLTELKNAGIRMPDGSILQGMGFPTLDEVLSLFGAKIEMNIHIKEMGPEQIVLRHLADYALTHKRDDFYIAGDRDILQAALDICPNIPRCCLAQQLNPKRLLRNALDFHCERVQFFRGFYGKEDLQRAREAGLIANLFYADEPEEAERAVRSGVVAVLTNNVGPVKTHLQQVGLLP